MQKWNFTLNIADEAIYHNFASHLVMKNGLMYHRMGDKFTSLMHKHTQVAVICSTKDLRMLNNKGFASASWFYFQFLLHRNLNGC